MMQNKTKSEQEKYYFFLNPYKEYSFSKCPKCNNKTKQKKLPLTIMLEKEKNIFVLNKTCKYCPFCELLIAKKQEIKKIVKMFLGKRILREKDYYVIGTQDKKVWRKGMNMDYDQKEQFNGIILFKDIWNFEVQPAGWYRDNKNRNKKLRD